MVAIINGEERELEEGLTIAGLLANLGVRPKRVAVEVNLEIVPAVDYQTRALSGGDVVEVVQFVGGG